MFSMSYDRFDPEGVDPSGPEIKIAWRTRWMIDVQHLLIVYVPDVSVPPPTQHPTPTNFLLFCVAR